MIRSLPFLFGNILKTCKLSQVLKYRFASEFTIDPFVQHYAQLAMRHHRRLHLNRSVLNQNKDVIYAQVRKPDDGMINLKLKGKCPGVIERISGKVEEQIDIVLDGKKMRKLSKREHYPLVQLYVRVQGKQYRCIFYHKQYHQDGFLQKVYLKQYVPGQPNKLTIPLETTHFITNAIAMRIGDVDRKRDEIDVICYNEQYPMRFFIDISYCSPDRPYRIGDLANILPPGIIIDPKYNMNEIITHVHEQQKVSKAQRQELLQRFSQSGKRSKQASKAAQTAKAGGAAGTPGDAAGKDKAAGTTATSTPGGAASGGAKTAPKK